jgi:hypothetical protein
MAPTRKVAAHVAATVRIPIVQPEWRSARARTIICRTNVVQGACSSTPQSRPHAWRHSRPACAALASCRRFCAVFPGCPGLVLARPLLCSTPCAGPPSRSAPWRSAGRTSSASTSPAGTPTTARASSSGRATAAPTRNGIADSGSDAKNAWRVQQKRPLVKFCNQAGDLVGSERVMTTKVMRTNLGLGPVGCLFGLLHLLALGCDGSGMGSNDPSDGGGDSAVPQSCAGATTCSNPPAPYCLDGTTLRSYSSPGACSGGFCSYAPVDTTCGNGCQGAACKTKSGPCGPSNCSGCCTAGGQCDSGGLGVSACGTGGQACAACQTGALCSSHKCSGMRICAAGDQLSCLGSTSKSWNGSQCCVDGAYQCVDGTSLDCATGSTDRQWTGQQCCLQFQALCTTGTSLSCSTGSTIKKWTGSRCCVIGGTSCSPSVTDCAVGHTDRVWTGTQCCFIQ